MKNQFYHPAILFTCLLLILVACKQKKTPDAVPVPAPVVVKPYNDSTIIVWMIPGSSKSQFITDIGNLASDKGLDISYCTSCDSTLALLTGPDAYKALDPVAQGATGGSGGTGGGPAEGAPGYYWMVNFNMLVKDSLLDANVNVQEKPEKQTVPGYSDGEVVVGVLDTGVDTIDLAETGFLFNGSELPENCIGSRAASGWNFTVPDANLADEYHPVFGHGTNAAWFIKDEGNRFGKTRPKILPVKVIPANAPATLYHVLCGLAYAQERGAKIINASLGYYSCNPRSGGGVDSGSIIFGKYIHEYLTKNSILLVAAGGNRDDDQQSESCGRVTRDLDEIDFFPASFSKDSAMKNVIAVTTVSDTGAVTPSVSPRQNFSKSVIDIGVYADQVNGEAYAFRNTRFNNYYIEGSSYAAPIGTGIIAAHYHQLLREIGATGNKTQVIEKLKSLNVLQNNPGFNNKIKEGIVASHY